MTLDLSPVARVAHDLAGQATPQEWIFQAAIAVAGIAVAWFVARALCGRISQSSRWQFGKGEFESVLFPVLAIGFVWAGKLILGRFHPASAMEIVLSILVAFLLVRIAKYILGHVIPDGGFQHALIRIVTWIAWITVALHVAGLLDDVLIALDSHGFRFGKEGNEVTLLRLLRGIAALFISIVTALWVSRVSESRILAAESMEMTTRVVITKALRVGILVFAFFVALPLAGIDLTTLSILTGAFGVGLGFGLQKVVSNYISGFIVLLDRSLRIGDVITLDGKRGEVVAIRSRYTVVRGGDGVESIVPNEKLITESVSHHTYSDPKVSVVISLTVAYESDIEKACQLLAEAAKRQARVVTEPPVAARVKGLTERGVELEATVWIADPAMGDADLRSELLKDVIRTFRTQGIEIAYARRDIRILATAEMQDSIAKSAP
jgi:small-conductance mechanosensitive channel